MIQGQFQKSRLTRWLLPVVLVLSLFTFSGSSSHCAAKQFDVRTEQIDPLRTSNKRWAFFKISDGQTFSSNSTFNYQLLTLRHTHDVNIQFMQSNKSCLEFIVFNHSLLLYSPRSSDEDFFIFQVG